MKVEKHVGICQRSNRLIRPCTQTFTPKKGKKTEAKFSKFLIPTNLTYLGLLDAGHVLFGQAGAVQGLLWIVFVALQHLGLQLRAQRCSLPGSTQKQGAEEGGVSVILPQPCQLGNVFEFPAHSHCAVLFQHLIVVRQSSCCLQA